MIQIKGPKPRHFQRELTVCDGRVIKLSGADIGSECEIAYQDPDEDYWSELCRPDYHNLSGAFLRIVQHVESGGLPEDIIDVRWTGQRFDILTTSDL